MKKESNAAESRIDGEQGNTREERFPVSILISLFVVFWAAEIFVTKLAFLAGAKVIPLTIQGGCFALLTLSLLVLPSRVFELQTLFSEHRGVFLMVLGANALHYGIGVLLYLFGISMTKAINVAFLVTLTSLSTTILARVFLAESIPAKKLFALFAMLIGAYLLTTNLKQMVPGKGDLLILGAVLFWSCGNVLLRKALRDTPVSGELVSFLKPIVGLPIFLVAIALADLYPEGVSRMFKEPLSQFDHLHFAALGGVLGAMLWIFLYRALKQAEASYVSMLGLCTPVLVTILAVCFLGETVSGIQVLGAAMILSAGVFTHALAVRAA